MASHLVGLNSASNHVLNKNLQANIFGTEQDRVNCSFYYKVYFLR